jgi:hypothetical protein
MAGFPNKFQAHRRAFRKGKPVQGPGIQEEFSKLISEIIEVCRNFSFTFFTKRQLKIVKTISTHKNSNV